MITIEYILLTSTSITKDMIGKTVMSKEGASKEFGIITDYTSKSIEIQYAGKDRPLLSNYYELYILNIKKT